ncbi:hypothetical protein QA639_09785 [Bradyrhizobium pachyrhizi]|uniref:DUF6894 family protein n=1 Tax=Bradyrhizobium TaxID=374 RepID=UPI000413C3F9|nr:MULTISPECIES: hypothetical protein [Bradyrhizobium]WFU57765.1 hypothetical protein QA639_09785 [Bradyrhizobium pachyrhizi]WOH83310.1 hypothetical protein RX327_09310 [Bradyrhizobium sp. BEA-2-5]
MSRYYFHITNGHPFDDPAGEELQDEQAAWQQALLTVRDIESNLGLDASNRWSLVVKREDMPVFQIEVTAKRLGSS